MHDGINHIHNVHDGSEQYGKDDHKPEYLECLYQSVAGFEFQLLQNIQEKEGKVIDNPHNFVQNCDDILKQIVHFSVDDCVVESPHNDRSDDDEENSSVGQSDENGDEDVHQKMGILSDAM